MQTRLDSMEPFIQFGIDCLHIHGIAPFWGAKRGFRLCLELTDRGPFL